MKTLSNFILIVILVIVIKPSNAQFVQGFGSSWVTQSLDINTKFQTLNNDIIFFQGNRYEINVWDDVAANESGILLFRDSQWGYNCPNGNFNNYVNFPNSANIISPDVTFLSDGTKLYAAVAYYNITASRYFLDIYNIYPYWSDHCLNLNSSTSFYSGGFGTSIHIASDPNGQFAVTWDEPTTGEIMILTGTVSPGFTLYNGGVPVVETLSMPGFKTFPDISLYCDVPSTDTYIYISYLANNDTQLEVIYDRFPMVASGIATPGNMGIYNSNYLKFSYPRIASPFTTTTGLPYNYTVVVEDHSFSPPFNIRAINFDLPSGILADIVINDGTFGTSGPDITDAPNSSPVVTYSHDGLNIWIGWLFDNSTPTYGTAVYSEVNYNKYPLALKFDNLLSNVLSIQNKYLEVENIPNLPPQMSNYSAEVLALSSSPTFTINVFSTGTLHNNVYHPQITDKPFNNSNVALRTSGNSATDEMSTEIGDLPAASQLSQIDKLHILVYDNVGKEVINTFSTISEVVEKLRFKTNSSGLYIIRAQSKTTGSEFITKINLMP